MKINKIIMILLGIILLSCGVYASTAQTWCKGLAYSVACFNGSTGETMLTGVKVNYSSLTNVPAGGPGGGDMPTNATIFIDWTHVFNLFNETIIRATNLSWWWSQPNSTFLYDFNVSKLMSGGGDNPSNSTIIIDWTNLRNLSNDTIIRTGNTSWIVKNENNPTNSSIKPDWSNIINLLNDTIIRSINTSWIIINENNPTNATITVTENNPTNSTINVGWKNNGSIVSLFTLGSNVDVSNTTNSLFFVNQTEGTVYIGGNNSPGRGTFNPPISGSNLKLDIQDNNASAMRITAGLYAASIGVSDLGGIFLNFGTRSSASSLFQLSSSANTNFINTQSRNFRIFSTTDSTGINYVASNGYLGLKVLNPTHLFQINGTESNGVNFSNYGDVNISNDLIVKGKIYGTLMNENNPTNATINIGVNQLSGYQPENNMWIDGGTYLTPNSTYATEIVAISDIAAGTKAIQGTATTSNAGTGAYGGYFVGNGGSNSGAIGVWAQADDDSTVRIGVYGCDQQTSCSSIMSANVWAAYFSGNQRLTGNLSFYNPSAGGTEGWIKHNGTHIIIG